MQDVEDLLMNVYRRHGEYAVWAHNARVSDSLITVMGRTVPEANSGQRKEDED